MKKKAISTRFVSENLPGKSKACSREIYPDGDWLQINDYLFLTGWDYSHRQAIHQFLKHGLSLVSAIKRISNIIGKCPIKSKEFFINQYR